VLQQEVQWLVGRTGAAGKLPLPGHQVNVVCTTQPARMEGGTGGGDTGALRFCCLRGDESTQGQNNVERDTSAG
jgi:hypothetical protein